MKINIEAEGMGNIPHSAKIGACYNYSSGVIGEISDPVVRKDIMGNPVMRNSSPVAIGIPNGGSEYIMDWKPKEHANDHASEIILIAGKPVKVIKYNVGETYKAAPFTGNV